MSDVLPSGKEIYQEDHNGMCIHGISYNRDNLYHSAPIIADICFDTREQKKFEYYIHSISETGFQPTKTVPALKDWQVGEGFAEAYLSDHFSCNFPWSNTRDLKNPNSSPTGADMLGFYQGEFFFGEVKTSTEQKYPPQVTSKKVDGLNIQLKNLCHDQNMRWVLVQYLFHRAKGTKEYRDACTAYFKDDKNFYVFGVLVRDVEPNIKDWDYLKRHLKVHKQNKVSLIALYLPKNDGIQKLHAHVLSKGGKS